jgi:predicted amidohydrolase
MVSPSGLRALTALSGAEILFYSDRESGWLPTEPREVAPRPQRAAWQGSSQRGHAVTNGVYVADANRGSCRRGEAQILGASSFVAAPVRRNPSPRPEPEREENH